MRHMPNHPATSKRPPLRVGAAYGPLVTRFVLAAGLLLSFSACEGAAAADSGAAPVAVVTPPATAAPSPSPSPLPSPSPTPAPTPKELNGIVSEGDSISVFWAGNYTGMFAAAYPKIRFTSLAQGGASITEPRGGNGLVQRLPKVVALKPELVTILIGANDLPGFVSGGAWLDALWAYVADVKATGAKVLVGTVLPICVESNVARFRERRTFVNNEMRAEVGHRIDGVFDFAADPVIGPDDVGCDKNYFRDGVHPTGTTQEIMAKIYRRAVEKALQL